MDSSSAIFKFATDLLNSIQRGVTARPGSIEWTKLREYVKSVLESEPEAAEFIDEVNGVSVLQAATEDCKTADIAENVVRAIGFGKRAVINYQGSAEGSRQTALHLCCVRGSRDLVSLLVQYGADLEVRDKFGATPLHTAIKWVQYDCALELVRHGADINSKCSNGKTPYEMWIDQLASSTAGEKWRQKIEEAIAYSAANDISVTTWRNI